MAVGSALSLVAAAIYLSLSVLAPPVSREGATLESVPDLVKAMYLNIESFPCVRLLNLSGEIGCSNPGSEKIIAPIVRFKKSSDQLVQSSTVLLPLDQMPDFFLRVSNDQEFHQKVSGVLIESNGVNSNLQELSLDRKFPQARKLFHPTQIAAMIGILLGQVLCGTDMTFLYFYSQRRVHRLCERFQKKIRRLIMDIKQMLQNSTLLCRFSVMSQTKPRRIQHWLAKGL